jgi:hypothetical protein
MNLVCPLCKKPLMSRHSPLCAFCGAKLPAELLFTPGEKKKIEAEEKVTAERLERIQAEREKESQAKLDSFKRSMPF